MKFLRNKDYNELIQKVDDAKLEAKGYYDELNEANEYFKAIQQQINRIELPPMKEVSRQDIKDIYETSAPVQGVVSLIADSVAEIFKYLELTKNNEVDKTHWLNKLLNRPNDRFTRKKFAQAWAINKCLYGDAFIYSPYEVGMKREVKEMYCIPSHRINIKGGTLQPLKNYRVSGSKVIDINPKQICQSFDYNLDDTSFFGTSKIVAAARYLSVMDKAMNRQDVALKNGGVANVITPAKDTMGIMPKDADEVQTTFNDRRNVGKTMALRVPIDVHQLGTTPVDLNILSSHKEAVTALCFVFKIPVDLYYGQSKYENAKEAKKTIYEQVAIPMANEFGEDLIHFLGLDTEGYELTVNVDKIDVLKNSPGEILDNLTKMHASLNEKREAFGYPRIDEDWADQPMLPMNVQFGFEEDYDINEIDDEKA